MTGQPVWRSTPACSGAADVFFPLEGGYTALNAAKAICAGCDVIDQCAAYVDELERDVCIQLGVWAGRSQNERQAARREERRLARRQEARERYQSAAS